jgi:membrane protein
MKAKVIGPKDVYQLIKAAALGWNQDGAASMGAAIAYYSIFSIAPLLIIAIAVAGFFFGFEAARGQIVVQAQGLVGKEGGLALQALIESASKPARGIVATVVGLLAMAFGATGVFAELQGAMDRIWQVPTAKSPSGLWYLIRRRLLTFGMVLGVAFLLLISLIVSAGISAVENLWNPATGPGVLLQIVNFVVSFLIITGLFALMFKLLPRVSVAWGDVIIGAVATALMFELGKFLIGLYIGKSGITSGFGAAGTLVALLLWIYYSAQVFLFGAEFTWAYAKRFGSKKSHSPR